MSDADANFDSHEPDGAEQVDYNSDGHADGYIVHEADGSAYEVVDTNNDGAYDTVLVDTDGDGDADVAYTDSNEDGHWEQSGQAPSGGAAPDYASA